MKQINEKYEKFTAELKSELEKIIVEKLNDIGTVEYIVWEQYIDANDGDINICGRYARLGINNSDGDYEYNDDNEFDEDSVPLELQSKKKEIEELINLIHSVDKILIVSFYGYNGVKVIIDKNGKVTVDDYEGYY